ncbi:putative pentatricopeptide repeat-containing protein At1g12700, mitochondrial [Amaranthus tricolor]|uniref:putative pentatricopeptide repeat-containing protein At1g12700, mitochondrial n=1 Tax=Amaranthus tricolor TaxID=29722 RepID=UPI00258B1BFE|nr:putative pentatricopeptide repeat-containing protein At1g12700, mitochondrial [Amaranthus tricolor]
MINIYIFDFIFIFVCIFTSPTGTLLSSYFPLFYQSSYPLQLFHWRFYSDCHQEQIDFDDCHLFLESVRHQCSLGFTIIDDAISLFRHLISLHPQPSIVDYTRLFISMLKMKPSPPFSTVISLFRELHFSDVSLDLLSLTMLVNCFCRLGFVDFGFSTLGMIFKLGHQTNIVTYNTLLNGLVRDHRFDEADLLLDKIVRLGFQPTIFTYGAMFNGLCKGGNSVGALNLLSKMEADGQYIPNTVTYSTIIDGLCKEQRLQEALQLFATMKNKRILPNVITYNTLIRGMCTLGHWTDAKEMFNEMLNNNMTPVVETYNMMIKIYCEGGMVINAEAVIASMIKKGYIIDINSYNVLLSGYCLLGMVRNAETLLDLMVQNSCQPDV